VAKNGAHNTKQHKLEGVYVHKTPDFLTLRIEDKTMQLEYAKNPHWANAEHTMIDLTVRFAEIPEDLPFTASPHDCEAHGRDIYAKAIAGEFGVIAEFVPYVPTKEEKAEDVRAERDRLLAATDWTQLPDVPEAVRQAWSVYRQALRDVPQQTSFPDAVAWPEKPV